MVSLQGDDIFLDHLPETERKRATELCRDLVPYVDRFVTHSRFYAEKMSNLLCIPEEKMEATSLSIDLAPFGVDSTQSSDRSAKLKLGYLARIAPEKGLHNLVAAFIELAKRLEYQGLTLKLPVGWESISRIILKTLKLRFRRQVSLIVFTITAAPTRTKKLNCLIPLT